MKKLISIVITLCSATIAVIYGIFSVLQFSQMHTEPESLRPETSYTDAEETYISFEALYPVASWVEESYSGDPDRVRSTGYVIYDADHDSFICTIVLEEEDPGFGSLLRSTQLPAETRAGKDMSPITINGFLQRATSKQSECAAQALKESDVLKLYTDFTDSDEYRKAYFEDDVYGKTLGSMCQKLLDGYQQTDWYVVKQESHNLSTIGIWICFLTACLNILIFLISLIGLFRRNKSKTNPSAADNRFTERFFAEQIVYVTDWCSYNMKRTYRLSVLSVIIPLVICIVIGILAKATDIILSLYLPLGLLIGETIALILWSSQTKLSKPDKIINNLQKYLAKELPSSSTQHEFMEEYINTEPKWFFYEKTKEGMLWGKVSEQYWSILSSIGQVIILDASKLDEVETETISGTVKSGAVRIHYESYAVNFYYQNDRPKRKPYKTVIFKVKDNSVSFIELARKRAGNRIAITSK